MNKQSQSSPVSHLKPYIGRYAPSPSGRLHLGNLRTALLTWLHARVNDGQFLLRMDDIDTPRVVAGSDAQILKDLEWMGLGWDGDVYYQSDHLEDYASALDEFKERQLVYPCFCSRKDIQEATRAPHGKPVVYPGTCRDLSVGLIAQKTLNKTPAWRFNVAGFDQAISFNDGIVGEVSENLAVDCGDFVVRRADNLMAYQLTVVVDDYLQGITDVLRGEDLLHSTARQIALYQTLYSKGSKVDRNEPKYWHVPLMLDASGQRLSKRDGADSIEKWKSDSPEKLIGFLAHSAGLQKADSAISLDELYSSIDAKQLIELIR